MSASSLTHILANTVDALSEQETVNNMLNINNDGYPLPSGKTLIEVVDLFRSVLFPGFYGKSGINAKTIKYHIGVSLERLHKLLSGQILAANNFGNCGMKSSSVLRKDSDEWATEIVSRLPAIRETLATDVVAAYNGDPAAESYSEVISCYPVIKALTNYRIAHELLNIGVPLIPRMITEMAHSETGIDIHPAAVIGKYFTIDHGTGVVIGATCIIGDNVKLYQGVTLGAKSFPLDANGNPIKGIARHPIIKDDVVIYANATVLGRITIGSGSVIGANVWVTKDMPPDTRKYNEDNF